VVFNDQAAQFLVRVAAPDSMPSGTITAAWPPGFSRRMNSASARLTLPLQQALTFQSESGLPPAPQQ
jgi:hypothetical protein